MASTLPSFNDCCSPCNNTVPVTIIEGDEAGGEGSGGIWVADTIAALRLIASDDDNRLASVLGGATIGDGNGGFYYWVANSSEADNGNDTIRPADFVSAGLWKKWF